MSDAGGPDGHHFHYRREERLGRHYRDLQKPRSRGILRGNRSLLILLLDLLLVLMLYLFATIFLFPERDKAELDGWSLRLSGYRVGQDVASMLEIRRIRPVEPDQQNLAQITFRSGDRSASVEEVLPEEGDRTIRVTLPDAGTDRRRIEAEIILGDRKTKLQAVLDSGREEQRP